MGLPRPISVMMSPLHHHHHHHHHRRSRTSIVLFTMVAILGGYSLLHLLVSPRQPLVPVPGSPPLSPPRPQPPATYHNYTSSFSFDLDQAVHPSWMSRIPDTASLASLSIPGTHDTLTFDLVGSAVFQCQNHDLRTQLRAGLRYFDVRGRLLLSSSSSSSSSAGGDSEAPPPSIGIFHGHVFTGYTLQDVLLTVFAFLDEHPSEGIVMRVKEEGTPLPADGDPGGGGGGDDDDDRAWTAGRDNVTFEEAFNSYRLHNNATAQGCEEHLLLPWPAPSSSSSSSSPPPRSVPTMGELRGRILVLYEFDTAAGASYGIPWASDHIALEDLWVILDPQHLDRKWDAVRQNLLRAGASGGGDDGDDRLFLSHLSASVGVLPIEAAAGPLADRSNGSVIAGINERTGLWLEGADPGERGKTGVVMGDFPGRRLVEDILRRNEWLAGGFVG